MRSETGIGAYPLKSTIESILDSSTDKQKAEFLRQINESGNANEIVAELANIIKERATLSRIQGVSDIVGTGGDSKNTINVSTAAAFVVSAMGVKIAKHGNFGATSNKGSADFLKFLGYNFEMNQAALGKRIRDSSFAFILAPRFNDSFAKFAKARKMIPAKTAFNYLGPITNPADPDVLMLGVTHEEISRLYVNYILVNKKRGCVIYSEDGMDEVSSYSNTNVVLISEGKASNMVINPEEIIGEKIGIEHISSSDPETSFKLTVKGLEGTDTNAARFIAINAALSLVINGKSVDMKEAYRSTLEIISSGLVQQHIQKVMEVASDA